MEASYIDIIEPILEPCMKGQRSSKECAAPKYNVYPALTEKRELPVAAVN